jgi:probable HAF family extracellular repeat protein
MKDKLRILTVLAFGFAVLASAPARSYAQNQSKSYHHYRLVDLSTLGGPQSYMFELTGPLSSNGSVAACADLATLDPSNPPSPAFLGDAYLQHGVKWTDGKLKDLGTLPGGRSSCTQWINSAGWIVGSSENGALDSLTGYPALNAVLWKNGQIRNLGTLGGEESLAYAINNNGEIVGFALNTIPDSFASKVFAFGATQAHAFLWKNGAMEDLGTLGGPDSFAFFVNERGQVSGLSLTNSIPNATTGAPTLHTFFWERGKMQDVGTLGGTVVAENDMNNGGEVVGLSNLAGDQTFHPFSWHRGVLTDLGTFGGDDGNAIWVNDTGQVVGMATFPIPCDGCLFPQVYHTAAWEDDEITDLETVPGDRCSEAHGNNAAGQVVGGSGICHGAVHAFSWEEGSPMIDLNTLIPPGSGLQLHDAIGINDRGEIAGTGTLANGDQHAFLLIPCDVENPGVQECDDNLVSADVATQGRTAQISQAPVASSAKLSPTEIMTRSRSLRAGPQ